MKKDDFGYRIAGLGCYSRIHVLASLGIPIGSVIAYSRCEVLEPQHKRTRIISHSSDEDGGGLDGGCSEKKKDPFLHPEARKREIKKNLRAKRPAEREQEDYGDIVLTRMKENGPYKSMDAQESLFCQMMVLEVFEKECFRVFSDWHAGPGQMAFGSDRRQRADLTLINKRKKITEIKHYNYHGMIYHNTGNHIPSCPEFEGGSYAPDTMDYIKTELAKFMCGVDKLIQFTYEAVNECDFFHKGMPDPSKLNKHYEGRLSSESKSKYKGVRDFLKREKKTDSVLGLGTNSFSQRDLVRRIVNSKPNSEGNEFGGFVYISGGRETAGNFKPSNLDSSAFSFCHQRTVVKEKELGGFTKMQSEMLHERGLAGHEKYIESCQTVLKKTFPREGELIGLDYFRFLVTERGLKDYKILHFLFYRHKMYMTPFLNGLLQQRHNIKKAGGGKIPQEFLLKSNCLKLIPNSIYGYASLESTSFSKTTSVTESHLARVKKGCRYVDNPNITDIKLVGYVDRRSEVEKTTGVNAKNVKVTPDLLYAVTHQNKGAAIQNFSQLSACILSQSRVVFLSKILILLCIMDPGKFELSYIDTDSIVIATHEKKLEDNLIPGVNWNKIKHLLVEDPNSEEQQSGLLKCEGVFDYGFFKAVKCYLLGNRSAGDEMKRMKSLPRRFTYHLKNDDFGMDPNKVNRSIPSVLLRATPFYQMIILKDSKSLGHCLNFKRKQVVRIFRGAIKKYRQAIYLSFFSQDPVHTLAL